MLPPFTDDLPELDPPPAEGRDAPPPPLEAPCDILCASIFMPHKMRAKMNTETSRMKDDLNFISLLFEIDYFSFWDTNLTWWVPGGGKNLKTAFGISGLTSHSE